MTDLRGFNGRPVHITVSPHGHLDMATLPTLRCGLARQVDQPPAELLVDLPDVPFLSAETLGLLAAAQLRKQGCRMYVRARNRPRLFRLCGLTHLPGQVKTGPRPGLSVHCGHVTSQSE